MKTVFEHIEHIKGKPHHVRKNVAFATASVTTGLVALVWLGGSLATNSFAIQGSSFADSAGQGASVQAVPQETSQNIAGVAGAVSDDTSGPARIEIVTVTSTSTMQQQAEQTIIPF